MTSSTLTAVNTIATRIFGWYDIDGMWGWTRKSLSGWKVATDAKTHTPGKGYFRPDRSYYQLYYCVLPILGARYEDKATTIRVGSSIFPKVDKRVKLKELVPWLEKAIERQPALFNEVVLPEIESWVPFLLKEKHEFTFNV